MVKLIDHVGIAIRDIEQTLDFYTKILGFTIKQSQPGRSGGPFHEIVYLALGDTMLEVIAMPEAVPLEERSIPGGLSHDGSGSR